MPPQLINGERLPQHQNGIISSESEPQFPPITKEQLLDDLGDFSALRALNSRIADDARIAHRQAAAAYEGVSEPTRDRAQARLEMAIHRSKLADLRGEWFADAYFQALAEDLRGRPIRFSDAKEWPNSIRGQIRYLHGRNAPKADFLRYHRPGDLLFEVRPLPDGRPVNEITPRVLCTYLTRYQGGWYFADQPPSAELSLAS